MCNNHVEFTTLPNPLPTRRTAVRTTKNKDRKHAHTKCKIEKKKRKRKKKKSPQVQDGQCMYECKIIILYCLFIKSIYIQM